MTTEKNKVLEIRHTRQQYMDLCQIQCALRTLSLYKGNIDGWFGKDSLDAFEQLIDDALIRPDSWFARDVFFALQRGLCAAGQGVAMDGIWGCESQKAFDTLIQRYRRQHQCMSYGCAWSRRNVIQPEDWVQMRQWLVWNGRDINHLSYLTSVIAYETNEQFYRITVDEGRPTPLEGGKPQDVLSLREYLSLYFQLLSGSRRVDECHTFDNYALTSYNGYPITYDRRTQPNGTIIANPVGSADSYLWEGLMPVNRSVGQP